MIEPTFEGRCAFIREHTRLQSPPHTPELALHLADEITPIWRMTEEALEEIGHAVPGMGWVPVHEKTGTTAMRDKPGGHASST